ncbi:hypothetical protein BRD06_04120 [Halobacteriales archaeon QS_9_67_15]|nr:MAG: hypothetical protein BRD06_04120 [Halobacteriales archaeon QS_9_67_15]
MGLARSCTCTAATGELVAVGDHRGGVDGEDDWIVGVASADAARSRLAQSYWRSGPAARMASRLRGAVP